MVAARLRAVDGDLPGGLAAQHRALARRPPTAAHGTRKRAVGWAGQIRNKEGRPQASGAGEALLQGERTCYLLRALLRC